MQTSQDWYVAIDQNGDDKRINRAQTFNRWVIAMVSPTSADLPQTDKQTNKQTGGEGAQGCVRRTLFDLPPPYPQTNPSRATKPLPPPREPWEHGARASWCPFLLQLALVPPARIVAKPNAQTRMHRRIHVHHVLRQALSHDIHTNASSSLARTWSARAQVLTKTSSPSSPSAETSTTALELFPPVKLATDEGADTGRKDPRQTPDNLAKPPDKLQTVFPYPQTYSRQSAELSTHLPTYPPTARPKPPSYHYSYPNATATVHQNRSRGQTEQSPGMSRVINLKLCLEPVSFCPVLVRHFVAWRAPTLLLLYCRTIVPPDITPIDNSIELQVVFSLDFPPSKAWAEGSKMPQSCTYFLISHSEGLSPRTCASRIGHLVCVPESNTLVSVNLRDVAP